MINSENLKDILLMQRNNVSLDKNIINRKLLGQLEEHKETPFIIIISGIRRSGKSTLLKMIFDKDCYYVNFDDERFLEFTVQDFQKLYEALVELFGEKKVFCFDEIQNIKGWERFIRRLHNENKKIYITGSNASMLSKEMGTHLTGRNISLELYPFSFFEFLEFKIYKKKDLKKLTSIQISKIRNLFQEYLHKGGFPEFLDTEKDEYLKSLYDNILYRDIITRWHLRNEKALKITALFAASNIGKEISFNKLKTMTGLTSATTIKEYFHYLENSYLVFLISRYDVSLKKQIYTNKKVYFIDTKLAEIIGFRFSEDKGRLLENVVFLQLKRMSKEIYFHKSKYECDFIIKEKNRINQAFQVTWNLNDENYKRETNGLLEAMEIYSMNSGTILTFAQEDEIELNGKYITMLPVWKWLLS